MSSFPNSEFLPLPGSLAVQHLLSQDFSAFLKNTDSWGIGAVWQLSPTGPSGSLAAYCTKPEGEETGKTEVLRTSLDSTFCDQLRPSLLKQTATPTPLPLKLPDCIQGRIQRATSPSSSPAAPSSGLLPECKTYVAGFSLGVAGAQWLILWHPQDLSAFEFKFFAQQFSSFKHHLAYQNFQQLQAAQIDDCKQVLIRTEHQLKTQLELLQLHADLLNQQLRLQAELQGRCPELQASIEQIQATISGMRHWIKRLVVHHCPSPRFDGPHDLSRLFEFAIQELRPLWFQKQLFIYCENHHCKVEVDAWQIVQVFQNILNNAIVFSPERGRIKCVWQHYCESEVLIKISDQGPGLTEKDPNQIFSPFYSRRSGGAGSGLAIAKQIVLAHCGRIWAENLATGGAQISIVLPIVSMP